MKNTPAWIADRHIHIHDDDQSSFEGVAELLRRCVGLGAENALNWARHISRNGSAQLGPWAPAIAQCIHDEMLRLAPSLGCRNLRVALEDAEAGTVAPRRAAQKAYHVLVEHFAAWAADDLVIVKREFPAYLRVDVQHALDGLIVGARRVGVHSSNRYDANDLASLLSERDRSKLVGALQFEDIDIGEDVPVRLPVNCLALLPDETVPLAVWVDVRHEHGEGPQLSVEILSPPGEAAAARTGAMLDAIEAAVAAGRTYRGKVLSLESSQTYRGTSANALTVHFRATVAEHELVLTDPVRHALDRHILHFAAERAALKALGQSGRKGVLLYGPPGTGKTHTIRYLAQRLHDHTTFLVTAEQIGLISTYFRLARLFAPSMIVIEDADLIARQRDEMSSSCDEVMLNRLLNEMDGLRADSDIFVIMTTNRPQTLEAALVQRPGRIDHAIEVPMPDAACRARLLHLYAGAILIDAPALQVLVQRTDGVSAAFIKELARRLAQQSVRAGHSGRVDGADVDACLDDMLSERDGLSLRLLGGEAGGGQ